MVLYCRFFFTQGIKLQHLCTFLWKVLENRSLKKYIGSFWFLPRFLSFRTLCGRRPTRISTFNDINIIIMFILRTLLSFEACVFWFVALKSGRSKSKGLGWKYCPSKLTLLLLLLSYDCTNISHYAMCNRGEKLFSNHLCKKTFFINNFFK